MTATTRGLNGSFTIDFTDTNMNALFDIEELDIFSGFLSFFGDIVVSVLAVPEILGVSVAGSIPGSSIYLSSQWNFDAAGSVDLDWDLAVGTDNWNYQISGLLAAIPLPASLPLLLAGLGGLAIVRRRRV